MKSLFNKTFSLFLFVFSGLFFAFNISANNYTRGIPIDSTIRYGVLENDLTYYIRHNKEPKNRASFYIVQNVGAILEKDEQNGLAHFLEHMAFNGTDNFPEKKLLEYLEKYGVEFGKNINAYTSTDETVYNISNVPVKNQNVLDSCLLILHDWSNYLTLRDDEIDAERGVITEEWRTRRNAGRRINEKEREVLYSGSKYAIRDVIGDMDIIKNFEYKTLRQFYHEWYRTDLQAIIIVGDIDAKLMEKKVVELFSKIPPNANRKKREYYYLPENTEPRYVLATDIEATSNYILLQYNKKINPTKRKDSVYLREVFTKYLFTNLVNNRVNEKLHEAKPPFISANISFRKMFFPLKFFSEKLGRFMIF